MNASSKHAGRAPSPVARRPDATTAVVGPMYVRASRGKHACPRARLLQFPTWGEEGKIHRRARRACMRAVHACICKYQMPASAWPGRPAVDPWTRGREARRRWCWPQAPRRLALGGIPGAGAEDDDETETVDGRALALALRCGASPIGVGFGSAPHPLFGEVSQDPAGSRHCIRRRSIRHVAAAVGPG